MDTHHKNRSIGTGTPPFDAQGNKKQPVNRWRVESMSTLKITVSEERVAKLEEKARRLQVTPEALLEASLEELLGRLDEEFQQVMERVLTKNAELYRRLAKNA